MLTEEDVIEKASRLSIHNRIMIELSKKCGCYYCTKIFDAERVKDYIDADDTAMCPFCGIDSVLPDASVCNLNKKLIKKVRFRWFGIYK